MELGIEPIEEERPRESLPEDTASLFPYTTTSHKTVGQTQTPRKPMSVIQDG